MNEQTYYRIDDAVFICEQQFMAMLIQMPLAVDREWFARLTLNNFMTPVFRSLFQAVSAAGGLPDENTPQGLWLHALSKAGGPMLEQVINELAVMPLPLPSSDNGGQDHGGATAAGDGTGAPGLHRPSAPESQYAAQLLVRLHDIGFMRRIGAARRRMAQLPDGAEKIDLLGEITKLETARKDLQDQVYGNAAA